MQQRVIKIAVDLGPQPADVHIDHIGLRIEVVVPHLLQQHGACDYLALMTHQQLQQAVFPGLQMYPFAGAGDGVGVQIENQIGDLQPVLPGLGLGASCQRFQTRQQFPEGIGLDQIIIAAGFQAGDAIVHFAQRRQHQRRRLVEFGETQVSEGAVLAYGPSDDFDLSLFTYRGRARSADNNAGRWDWGLATEFWFNQAWSAGLSYLSDLADADSRPLEDDNDRYERRVSGLSAYVLWAGEQFELTLEGLAATGSFRELDNDRDRPRAWNAELVYVGYPSFDIALRFEGSRELEDEPLYQVGAAATWRLGRRASLTVEYLHGEFSGELASTDDDQPYDHVDRLGAMLSVAF